MVLKKIFKVVLIFIMLLFLFQMFNGEILFSLDEPDEPKIIEVEDEKNDKTNNINIEFQYPNGRFGKGLMNDLANTYLKLSWGGNEMANQEILMGFVRSIKIKGYTMVKKTNDNLSMIFYFPHLFDIELKDGTFIKDAEGRIKEIESFSVYNSIGRQRCYTYFVRYWLEDKKVFSDNMSNDYFEKPEIPSSVVIYLEFKD